MMRMKKKVLAVLCAMAILGLTGSLVAIQGAAPTMEPAGVEGATRYESFEHFLAKIAALPVPDSAEALPPAPHTSCSDACGVGASNIYWSQVSNCIDHHVWSPACIGDEGEPGEPPCGTQECWEDVDCGWCLVDSNNYSLGWFQTCMDAVCGHGTNCSPSNPWC